MFALVCSRVSRDWALQPHRPRLFSDLLVATKVVTVDAFIAALKVMFDLHTIPRLRHRETQRRVCDGRWARTTRFEKECAPVAFRPWPLSLTLGARITMLTFDYPIPVNHFGY